MNGKSVGLIGLGIMGGAMAESLLKAGFKVFGCDVASDARALFAQVGGQLASSTEALVAATDIILLSLPSASAFEAVVREITVVGKVGLTVVDTSTIPPGVKKAAWVQLDAVGVRLLDCPLSGTGAQAKKKDICVYGSGERNAYDRALPVLQGFSRAQYFVGEFGRGTQFKLIANLLVAIHNAAAAEAIVLAQKAGLDLEELVRIVADGAGGSRMLSLRGPMMAKGDYREATMKISVWKKDMQIIREFAAGLDCPTPLFSIVDELYIAAAAQGLGALDTASVCKVLEGMAGVTHEADYQTDG